jgi:hypothetical protein
MKIMDEVAGQLKAEEVVVDDKMAKVSIVGVGMRSHPGVAAGLFRALADGGVNIDMISTSEIKVACMVRENDGPKAVRIAHKAFGLDKPHRRENSMGFPNPKEMALPEKVILYDTTLRDGTQGEGVSCRWTTK